MEKEEPIYKVNICCTGNQARSVMAEIIGNFLINGTIRDAMITPISDLSGELLRQIRFASSGTRADKNKYDFSIDYKKASSIYEKARQLGLSFDWIEKGAYINDPKYRESVDDNVRKAFYFLRKQEIFNVEMTLYNNLGDVGLLYYQSHQRTQLREDPSDDLVLAVARKNYEQAKELVPNKYREGKLELITKFAGVDIELPDLIGNRSNKPYQEMYDILRYEIMNRVVEKIIEEKIR